MSNYDRWLNKGHPADIEVNVDILKEDLALDIYRILEQALMVDMQDLISDFGIYILYHQQL